MHTDFVVVLPTSGCAPQRLHASLESLAACAKPSRYRETIVVENGPPAGARSVVEAFRNTMNARYVHVLEANKSAALNHVLSDVRDCFLFFTDDDVRIGEQTLMAYADAAASHSAGEFFGGPVHAAWDVAPPEWLLPFLPRSAKGWSLEKVNVAEYEHDYSLAPCPVCLETIDFHRITFLGFNWAAFERDISALGGFDPARGPGSPTGTTGQETDMQRRMLAAGVRGRYVSGAPVWHHVPPSKCSPEWALRRAYRNGQGAAHTRRGMQTFLGVPPQWMSQMAAHLAQWVMDRHDPTHAFRVRHQWHMMKGFVDEGRRLEERKRF